MHYVKPCQNKNCRFGEKDCWFDHNSSNKSATPSNETKSQTILNTSDFPPIKQTKAPDQQQDIMIMITEQQKLIQQLFQKISSLENRN